MVRRRQNLKEGPFTLLLGRGRAANGSGGCPAMTDGAGKQRQISLKVT